jgi:hypothetical protein
MLHIELIGILRLGVIGEEDSVGLGGKGRGEEGGIWKLPDHDMWKSLNHYQNKSKMPSLKMINNLCLNKCKSKVKMPTQSNPNRI